MEDKTTEKDASTVEATEKETSQDPSQDNIKKELDRINETKARTEADKAAFSLKKTAERLKELGGDPYAILKPEKTEELTDDAPLTVGMLKKLQEQDAQKTALSLADSISDDNERELVKHHLANTIRSSGNPQQDLSAARAIVNSVKNGQIAEELSRKGTAKSFSSASSAPERTEGEEFKPTEEEMDFMRPPFNLKKEDIIKSRQAQQ